MNRIHLSKADVTPVEEAYVLDALRSGWLAPIGPHLDAFETAIAKRVGVAGAVAVSSGTAALHLALLGMGVGPETYVPVSTLTFAATVNAIAYTGANPVLIDCQSSDGNIDPALMLDAVDTLLGDGFAVPAVVVVDLFGRCANYTHLEPQLQERGVALLEDAAEALGAKHGERAAGSFGRAGVLSFNGNKILTTSGGGMLLSDDLQLVEHARYLATQARQARSWYEHIDVGYNYRMSNILAALGLGQLERLDDMIARRRQIRDLYDQGLRDVPGLRFLGRSGSDTDENDNCWLTTIVLERQESHNAGAQIVKAMADLDIEARHIWKPMHLQPVFRGCRRFLSGAAERLFQQGVTLPSGAGLDDGEIGRVIESVKLSVALL